MRGITMHVTSKGQVTIPIEIREKLGIFSNSEVQFELLNGGAILTKAKKGPVRGERILRRVVGRGDVKMTTDEIMALTRGES
jgi:AbrB family looped-hinge helix DNA binding protein